MKDQLISVLKESKLLQGRDASFIDFNNIHGRLFTVRTGDLIFREGDTAESVYLIVFGKINLLKGRLLGSSKLLILRESDHFGYEEFIERINRTTTAVAVTDSYLIEFSAEEVRDLLNQGVDFIYDMEKRNSYEECKPLQEFESSEPGTLEILKEEFKNLNIGDKSTEKEISIETISEGEYSSEDEFEKIDEDKTTLEDEKRSGTINDTLLDEEIIEYVTEEKIDSLIENTDEGERGESEISSPVSGEDEEFDEITGQDGLNEKFPIMDSKTLTSEFTSAGESEEYISIIEPGGIEEYKSKEHFHDLKRKVPLMFENSIYGEMALVTVNLTECTSDNAESLKKHIDKTIEQGFKKIIIDLSQCSSMDSFFLNVLIICLNNIHLADGSLRLVYNEGTPAVIFMLSSTRTIFRIYASLGEAMNSLT